MKGDATRTRSMSLPSLLAIAVLAFARPLPAMVVSGRGLAEVYVGDLGATSLKPGQRLRLGAPPAVVAELEVVRIRDGVAVCRIVSQRRTIMKGDIVTAVAAPSVTAASPLRPPVAVPAASEPAPPPSSAASLPAALSEPLAVEPRRTVSDAPLLAVQALPGVRLAALAPSPRRRPHRSRRPRRRPRRSQLRRPRRRQRRYPRPGLRPPRRPSMRRRLPQPRARPREQRSWPERSSASSTARLATCTWKAAALRV